MNPAPFPTWRTVPSVFRAMGRWLMVVQVAGYTTALVFVRQTTRLTPVGIADHYRGSENAEGAMQFPKSFSEMLVITHTHLLSMAVVFVLSGIALALCERVPDRWKGLLCVEPFVAMLVSFSAMWLMRYVDPRFSLLLALSSGIMALTFYIQTVFIFRELGWRDRP